MVENDAGKLLRSGWCRRGVGVQTQSTSTRSAEMLRRQTIGAWFAEPLTTLLAPAQFAVVQKTTNS